MRLTVQLPPPDAAWLHAQAQTQGVEPAEYLRKLVHQQAALIRPPQYEAPVERISAMDAIAASIHISKTLPDAAFDRATLYEERK